MQSAFVIIIHNYLPLAIIFVKSFFCNNFGRDGIIYQACISLFRRFRTPGTPIRKILVYTGMLPCLVPQWPQIHCASLNISRSDLVLDADDSLDFLGRQFSEAWEPPQF